jgi:hypothetical protein
MTGLGHERHFERAPAMSALPPIATESLHCGNRRESPVADMRYTLAANKSHRPGMPFNS